MNHCPLGYDENRELFNICKFEGGPFIEFEFSSGDLPALAKNDDKITANAPNSPAWLDSRRGFWFDGVNDSLEITGADLAEEYSVSFYLRRQNANSSLLTMTIPTAGNGERRDILDIYVSECSNIVLQFG